MKSKHKYTTSFKIITIEENGDKKNLKVLSSLFFVFFSIYLIVSLVSTWLHTQVFIEVLLEVSDFFLLLASVLISIIAMIVGNNYNGRIADLLNGIIEVNRPLNIIEDKNEKVEKSGKISRLISIFSCIDLILTCVLFVANTIFQIVELCVTNPISWLTLTVYINTIAIDILMILLNVLSILDCIYSSKKYQEIICNIEDINQIIFDEYNKKIVNESLINSK